MNPSSLSQGSKGEKGRRWIKYSQRKYFTHTTCMVSRMCHTDLTWILCKDWHTQQRNFRERHRNSQSTAWNVSLVYMAGIQTSLGHAVRVSIFSTYWWHSHHICVRACLYVYIAVIVLIKNFECPMSFYLHPLLSPKLHKSRLTFMTTKSIISDTLTPIIVWPSKEWMVEGGLKWPPKISISN